MSCLKKYKDIIFILIMLIFISIVIMSGPLEAGDEFINYYNTYKIYNGEMIYKDVNIVATPLLFYIGIIFFKLFGTKLIVFRIYNICINILVTIYTYKIFNVIKIPKRYSVIYTLLLEIFIIKYVVGWGATYNILALLLCLIGLKCYINRDKIKRYEYKIGVIMFLIIMTKQNVGVFFSIAYTLTQLIINKKDGLKNILKTFSIIAILFLSYFAYLYFMGNLGGFINYTILGLKEFSNNILITAVEYIIIDLLFIFFVGFIIIKKKYLEHTYINTIILYVFGICMLITGYPIADEWHMIISSFILIICMFYALHWTIVEELDISSNKIYKIIYVIITMIAIFSMFKLKDVISLVCIDKTSEFYLIPIYEENKRTIKEIQQYISKDNTVIVSPEAGLYKINLGLEGDGIYDVPFLGNFGKNGEVDLIKN